MRPFIALKCPNRRARSAHPCHGYRIAHVRTWLIPPRRSRATVNEACAPRGVIAACPCASNGHRTSRGGAHPARSCVFLTAHESVTVDCASRPRLQATTSGTAGPPCREQPARRPARPRGEPAIRRRTDLPCRQERRLTLPPRRRGLLQIG